MMETCSQPALQFRPNPLKTFAFPKHTFFLVVFVRGASSAVGYGGHLLLRGVCAAQTPRTSLP